jgi:YD repeat-containing protein
VLNLASQAIVETYSYDAAGNRTAKTRTMPAPASIQGVQMGGFSGVFTHASTAYMPSFVGPIQYPLASTGLTSGMPLVLPFAPIVPSLTRQTTTYIWDSQDRLASVTLPDGSVHRYAYDYRTRRVGTSRSGVSLPPSSTAITFSSGLSVAEWESTNPSSLISDPSSPVVEYTRGPDMGGGVGGLLYTSRRDTSSPSLPVSSSPGLRYNLSNGRGDIVAQADQYASLTWTASYEAYGKRTRQTGENKDKQRGNSKDEDPTGLLNEGFRYRDIERDIETGVWLSFLLPKAP